QRAQGPLRRRVNVGRGNEIGTEQVREFFRVDAVVFVFAPVNGFDVESVSQDKRQAGSLAGIGQPIPPEHALAADGEAVLVRLDELEEVIEVVVLDIGVDQFFALAIHDADVHLTRMQIDSAVVFGRGSIIFHSSIQCWGVLRTPVNTVRNAGRLHSPPLPLMITKPTRALMGVSKQWSEQRRVDAFRRCQRSGPPLSLTFIVRRNRAMWEEDPSYQNSNFRFLVGTVLCALLAGPIVALW